MTCIVCFHVEKMRVELVRTVQREYTYRKPCAITRSRPIRANPLLFLPERPFLTSCPPRIKRENGMEDGIRRSAASSSPFPSNPPSDEYVKLEQASDVYLVSAQKEVKLTELWNSENDERCVFVWGRSMG